MTEDEARGWIRDHFGVSRETALARFETLLRAEAQAQNLVSAASLEAMWARHLVDSAQLVPLACGAGSGAWLDVGSGAGLPGMVVALLVERRVVLVEPRARRVAFLREAIAELGLGDRVSVVATRVERYAPPAPAAIVSARAVAELGALLQSTHCCTDSSTVWLLPKGRSAESEVDAVRAKWQGRFHVEPSITDAESGIVVARGVRPR